MLSKGSYEYEHVDSNTHICRDAEHVYFCSRKFVNFREKKTENKCVSKMHTDKRGSAVKAMGNTLLQFRGLHFRR